MIPVRSSLVRLLASIAATTGVVLVGVAGSSAAPQVLAPVNATERVSVDSSGGEVNGSSSHLSISGEGRFVAFVSGATNLLPDDTNGQPDIFVHDRQTGATERVSVDSSGGQANTASFDCAMSIDGRYVAFTSYASNLVPSDTNQAVDVFVHDRQTGTTERVSVDSSSGEANSDSDFPAITADGRFVAFGSAATNLVPGDTNGARDVFVHDRQTGVTERVNVDSSGRQANKLGDGAALSADGRFVGFASSATNLVPGDTNRSGDVFVHDRQTGTTERVSVDSSGTETSNGNSGSPAISGDGRFVAFSSGARNLVPSDTNDATDIFVHDRQTEVTERDSVDSSGGEGNSHSYGPTLSIDGRFVAFASWAKTLVPGDTGQFTDVFVHDRQTGTTERKSVDSSGGQANNHSSYGWSRPAISADGGLVAFDSLATNLVLGDTNGMTDAFVHHRHAPQIYSFAPTSGITGSTVTIAGVNFDGTTSVKFGKKGAKFKVLSPAQVRATLPNGATSDSFTVTNPDGTAKSPSDYTVTFSITKLAPKSGPVGTVVMLTGIGFSDVTSVKFHGASASFMILSPTSIRATVPIGATTGKVTATSSQGTVTGPKFTVTS